MPWSLCSLDGNLLYSPPFNQRGNHSLDIDTLDHFLFWEEPFKEADEGDEGNRGGALEAAAAAAAAADPRPPPDALLPTPTPTPPHPSSTTPTLPTTVADSPSSKAAPASRRDSSAPSSSSSASDPPPLVKSGGLVVMDGPPDDKEGFFGHPLTRAEIAINGEAQQDAQREALLHEYMNLEAWHEQGGRIRDCFAQVATSSGSVVPSAGENGDGDGGGTSGIVVAGCGVSAGDGDEARSVGDKPKVTQVASTNANDYFILLDPQGNELSKFDQFDPMLHGDPQVACPEVVVPFPDPAMELEVTSASLSELRAKDIGAGGLTTTALPKTTTFAEGAARRPRQADQGLPMRPLRRSESEPCTTLTETVFTLGGRLTALAETAFDDPFSAEALARECEEVAAEQTFVNGGPTGDRTVGVRGVPRAPSSAGCNNDGLDVALTVTASVVSSSGLPPRGHCVISSSSQPTLRISPAPNAPSPDSSPASVKPPTGARGKGRGSKGVQPRARGGQKEGGRGKGNKRRHSVPSTPTIITSTSAGLPLPSSDSIFFASSSPTSSTPAIPRSTSPAVLSSALPPEISTAAVSESVLTSDVSVASHVVAPSSYTPSSTASPASVLLLPLAHGAVLGVEPDSPAVVMPHQPGHSGVSVAAQTHSDSADPVKQTTKDKLKLRIAQTAMTQTPDPPPPPPPPPPTHHHHHQQQHQLMNGHGEIQRQPHPDPHPASYPQQYQLPQQHQVQQEQQQQQQEGHLHLQEQHHPSSASPEQPLPYLNEEALAAMNMGGKFPDVLPAIKQESQFLEYESPYPPPYTSEASSLQVLYNSISMATSGAVAGEGHPGLVSMAPVGADESQAPLSEAEIFSQMSSESLLVQPQFLHLLQPVDMGQPPQNQQQHPQQQQPQSQQSLNNGYYNPNDNLYIYNSNPDNHSSGKAEENLVDMDSDKTTMQYVHHQHQHQQQQQQHQPHPQHQQLQHRRPQHEHYGYASSGYQQYVSVDASPDSGIGHDPGLSPNAAVLTLKESGSDGITKKEGKSLKRRKSTQNHVLQRQCSSGSDKVLPRNTTIQKLEVNTTGYLYYLDAPTSTTQRIEEDRVTYLNKSQYYPLVLENTRPERVPKGVMCKSVIMLVFREEKSQEEESKAWQFWHSRQHSYKQRILDIDTKNSQGVGPSSISELAFNAVSVKWNPQEGPVRVNIAVHCLSTDFSNQKGVKGIPLHIQCDTYELFDSSRDLLPSHRGYCQIKVFCDKGAERKTRDEERRRNAKVSKHPDTSGSSPGRKRTEEVFHPPCERSEFYSLADLSTCPVYFSPSYVTGETEPERACSAVKEEANSSQQSPSESGEAVEESTQAKVSRLSSCASCNKFLTPLLYVKESHDKAYHAIHLELPTVEELLKAISHKFNKQLRNVTNFFKQSKNGMLVRMDDDIIRRYSHETAFLLEVNHEGREDMEVILLETSH